MRNTMFAACAASLLAVSMPASADLLTFEFEGDIRSVFDNNNPGVFDGVFAVGQAFSGQIVIDNATPASGGSSYTRYEDSIRSFSYTSGGFSISFTGPGGLTDIRDGTQDYLNFELRNPGIDPSPIAGASLNFIDILLRTQSGGSTDPITSQAIADLASYAVPVTDYTNDRGVYLYYDVGGFAYIWSWMDRFELVSVTPDGGGDTGGDGGSSVPLPSLAVLLGLAALRMHRS